MACAKRRLLEHDVDANAHHLQKRLKQVPGDSQFDLIDIKRMAQDLLDSIKELRKHETKHKCRSISLRDSH